MIAIPTSIKIGLVLGVIMLFAIPITHAYALQQSAGSTSFSLEPGESDVFKWGLKSDEESESITVQLSADKDGAEFLHFPDSIVLEPLEMVFVTITVEIPDDYPGGIDLKPKMYATQFGEEGGAARVNVRMVKTISLDIAPNDNPDLRVDWDALKAQEDQVATSENQPTEESESAKVETEESASAQKETQEKTENPSLGPTSIGSSEQNMDPEPETMESESEVSGEEGGGCLIATAAFGSELAPQVQLLREIRDNTVLSTHSGTAFMTGFNQFYYSFSPVIADFERENPVFKETVKIALTPLLTSLSILSYADIDSEEEMLGYGIGIILLNAGMYFAAPALIIVRLRKRN